MTESSLTPAGTSADEWASALLANLGRWPGHRMSTARIEYVVAEGASCELTLLDGAGVRSRRRVEVLPDRGAVDPQRRRDALSVIVTVGSRPVNCVLVMRRGRTQVIAFAEALAFLDAGVHGVVRWSSR